MTLLLQISDPHFGTEKPDVVEALLRLASREKPQLVVMSGDITQRARRSQFDAAQRFVERLVGTPLLVIPGNHDIPLYNVFARVLQPYAGHRRVFGANLEPVFESADFLVIGVNTTRPSRHTDGEVSLDQVERVSQRLRQATPAQLRVVVTHQPVAAVTGDDTHNLLHGREHAVPAWSQAGTDVIMGGHVHLPYVLPLHERAMLPRPVWAVQAGTALSTRVRGGICNSVNLLRYDAKAPGERSAVLARYDYEDAAQEFVPVLDHTLAFANRDDANAHTASNGAGRATLL